jgi:hypothetical protein
VYKVGTAPHFDIWRYAMDKARDIKKQIDTLPAATLVEVEKFIMNLKKEAVKPANHPSLLLDLAESAFEDDLPADLAKQHDHYLYGVSKK